MIEARGLTKTYGSTRAVDGLTFDVRPGRVTGFLGPNGAGKSTTMRMIIGLDRPSAGTVRLGGRPYAEIRRPLHEVGAVLETRAVHGGRSAFNHLLCLAQSNGIATRRVREVLDLVGLEGVATRRAGGFSLGMSQRLGLAAALLGDPPVLLCDEPVNGLDPEGILWVRTLLRRLAAEGRTVFVSSHLMSEMALTADHLVVVGRGRLIADASTSEIIARSSINSVLVRSPDAARLAELLSSATVDISRDDDGALRVKGVDAAAIGDLAARHAIALHELSPQRASLEAAFMKLTHDSVDFPPSRWPDMSAVINHPVTPPTTIGFGNLLRSEWTKLRSIRSTYWTATVAVLATVALGAVISAQWEHNLSDHKDSLEGFDATLTSLNGIYLAQVAVGALGVLVISSEYSTGMIRATLGAVPQRRALLAAKGIVFATCTLIIGEILSFTAFSIGQAILNSAQAGASLSQPGVLRATIGGGLYLTAVGLLGFGLGALIRHTAGALSAFFGVLFASTAIVDLLPTSWRNDVIKFMPANAGSQILTVIPGHDALSPWTGLAVFCLYPAAAITAAVLLITHRDA